MSLIRIRQSEQGFMQMLPPALDWRVMCVTPPWISSSRDFIFSYYPPLSIPLDPLKSGSSSADDVITQKQMEGGWGSPFLFPQACFPLFLDHHSLSLEPCPMMFLSLRSIDSSPIHGTNLDLIYKSVFISQIESTCTSSLSLFCLCLLPLYNS